MQKPGWNARRRNRNIGTAKSGYGQDNRLTIPESWADERHFYEKLNNTARRWSKSLTPDDALELQRLERDGH